MVRIRLMRMGAKHKPYYRIVVVDSKKKRDGAYIESIGYYAPLENGKFFIDLDKYQLWVSKGAQPSDVVSKLVKRFQEAKS
jgi:small subunit ribosomal protein S16